MPPKKKMNQKDKPLTKRDAQVFQMSVVEGKTNVAIAKELDICTRTVQDTKKKSNYREIAIQALAKSEFGLDLHMGNLVELTKATKTLVSEGKVFSDADNPVRLGASKELSSIYGIYAPKEVNVEHTIGAMSDNELFNEIQTVSGKRVEVIADVSDI